MILHQLFRKLTFLLTLSLTRSAAASGVCSDRHYLVSGPQPMVDKTFPQNGRLYNNKGWMNETIKATLTSACKVKDVAIQACDSSGTTSFISFKIKFKPSFTSGWRFFVEYVFGTFMEKIYSTPADCTTVTTFGMSSTTAAEIKVVPVSITSTQGFHIDVLGCLNGTIGISRWMTSFAMRNINFTDGIIWKKSNGSVYQCSRECDHDITCRSFIYNQNGFCQGHNLNTFIGTNALHQDGVNLYISNDDFKIDSKTFLRYKMFALLKRNSDASKHCTLENAKLVVVDSREKLQSLWNAISGNLILAQATKFHVSGDYTSADTWEYWTTYKIPDDMWYGGMPNNPTEKCVGMTRNGLVETNCSDEYYFICEKM